MFGRKRIKYGGEEQGNRKARPWARFRRSDCPGAFALGALAIGAVAMAAWRWLARINVWR